MRSGALPSLALGLVIGATGARAPAQAADAPLPSRVGAEAFQVTTGTLRERPGQRLGIEAPELRAVLRAPTLPAAAIRFTYLGPTLRTKPLASGEIRRQIGLKLRAQDTSNVVYVMWHIEPDTRIAVSVKRNPGQRTHAECGARGYTTLRARRSGGAPPIAPGSLHTLQAELRGSELAVRADGAVVWEGTLAPGMGDFDGPVGLRTDNARFELEYFVGGLPLSGVPAEPGGVGGAARWLALFVTDLPALRLVEANQHGAMLVGTGEGLFSQHRRRLWDVALRHRLPLAVSGNPAY